MADVKNHPNALPTRKIFAVIIAGAVVGGLQAALSIFWPDHPFSPLFEDIDSWVQMGVMVAAGYMTKERVDA